jgi:hypothetical protein
MIHNVFAPAPDRCVGKTFVPPAVLTVSVNLPNRPNGDIFVADGHRDSVTAATGNNRIVHFFKDGKFISAFGRKGTGPGEMREPHSIAFDSRGHLFIADRMNNRIEIFDQD